MTDADRPAAPRGFSTRAIQAVDPRAARSTSTRTRCRSTRPSRSRPSDADELGAISTGQRARLLLRADRQPDRRRPSPTRSPSSRAPRPRTVFASGMAAIHAALLSLVQAGDRIVATPGDLRLDPDAADPALRPARRRRRVRRRDRPGGGRGGAGRGADPASCTSRRSRTRRSSSSTSRPWPSWPTGTARLLDRRQHVRLAVSCAGRSSSAPTSSSSR